MGTVVTIDVYGGDHGRDDELNEAPGRDMRYEADDVFSAWKADRLPRNDIALDDVADAMAL